MSLRNQKWKIVLLFFILVVVGAYIWRDRPRAIPAYNNHNLLRLHVIANSDTFSDQELKREIRDAVLVNMGSRLRSTSDIFTARRLASSSLKDMTAVARAVITREGKDYPVRAEIGDFVFPTRAYGDVVLPAGNYEAVRLIIGEGMGENWWCVLFPPLCLVDVTGKKISNMDNKPVEAATMEVSRKHNRPVEFRWKIIEVFKGL